MLQLSARPPPPPPGWALGARPRCGASPKLHLWRGVAAHASAAPPSLVSDLLSLARAGTDAPAIQAAAEALAPFGPGPPPPSPSVWRTLYSNSPGPSGGRVLGIQGETTQVFHPSAAPSAGTYTNQLAFGGSLAVLELSGDWEAVRPDRVNVAFTDTRWSVLGGLLKGGPKPFAPEKRPRGHWGLLYGDGGVRAFTTNKGSLFVLERSE